MPGIKSLSMIYKRYGSSVIQDPIHFISKRLSKSFHNLSTFKNNLKVSKARLKRKLKLKAKKFKNKLSSKRRLANTQIVLTSNSQRGLAIEYNPAAFDPTPKVKYIAKTRNSYFKLLKNARRLDIVILRDSELTEAMVQSCKVKEDIPAEYYTRIAKIFAKLIEQEIISLDEVFSN